MPTDYSSDFSNQMVLWKLLLLFLFSFLTLFFAIDYLIYTDDITYLSLGDQLSIERITNLIELGDRFKWLSYGLVILFLFSKLLIVATCIIIGILIQNGIYSFWQIFRIVIIAEFVLLIPFVLKLFWFSLIQVDYTLVDLHFFSPLSILNLLRQEEIEPWLSYPLQLLNLFEATYWCTLALQLKAILNRDFVGSLSFVASTYGVGLLLWVIFVMFLTVSIT